MSNKKLDNILNQKELRKIKMLLRAMDHPIRQEMMVLLNEKDCTVTEIYTKLKLVQSICSQQLKILRDAEVVKVGRIGKERPYSLNKEYIKQVSAYITKMAEIAP